MQRLSLQTEVLKQLPAGSSLTLDVPKTTHHQRAHSARLFANAIENARQELSTVDLEEDPFASPLVESPEAPSTPDEAEAIPSVGEFAFAFDIDGVLIRGGDPIPQAVEAMRYLNGDNEYGVRVPYIFLTNGGGKTEEERCGDLSRQLDLDISPAQFICGHTPMKEMVEKYNTVLVVGGEGEKCRQVAEGYGFKDVITPGDIIKSNEDTTPFRRLTDQERERSKIRNFRKTKIEAIFVFADSRDWAGDIQIILDIAMSINGYIGTRSETFDEGPPIYFSHNDIVWSAAHEHVRIGMGALRKTVENLFREVTKGKELNTIAFGKPQIGTFEFATRLLRQWRKDEHRINAAPDTVYFVGDTPESDIKGTNEFNEKAKNEWYSILVRTGVFQEGTEPAYKPMATVDTVLDAVKHGMQREFEKRQKRTSKALSMTSTTGEVTQPPTPVTNTDFPSLKDWTMKVAGEPAVKSGEEDHHNLPIVVE